MTSDIFCPQIYIRGVPRLYIDREEGPEEDDGIHRISGRWRHLLPRLVQMYWESMSYSTVDCVCTCFCFTLKQVASPQQCICYKILYRAKNHISQYFARIIFNVLKQILSISFICLVKTCLDFIGIKEINLCEKRRNYSKLKTSGKIWSPGEIWLFALHWYYRFCLISFKNCTKIDQSFVSLFNIFSEIKM